MYDDYQIEFAVAVGVFVVFVLSFLLKATDVLTGVVVGSGVGWAFYRVVGYALYRSARRAWQGAAERLELTYRESTTSVPVESTTWVDDLALFVILLANNRTNFSLTGRVDGEWVDVTAERTTIGRSTVITVDFGGDVPDWLEIRKGWGTTTSRDWFDIEDVLVGDARFDNHFLVRGRHEDAIREFFLDYPATTDLLVSLGRRFANVELADSRLRIAVPTVERRTDSLVAVIETVADHASRLREHLREPEVTADFDSDDEQSHDREAASEVHVYESS